MSSSTKCLLSIIKSFNGQYEDEISVEVGQIAQFINKIDKFWYEVYIEDRVGKIPIDCCREIKADMLSNLKISPSMKQVIFISKHDFINHCEEGDLKFSRFEVIIGFHPIDDDWWNGARLTSVRTISNHLIVKDSDCGIFPLTYVWKLRNDLLPEYIFDSKGIILESFLDKKDDSVEDIDLKLSSNSNEKIDKEDKKSNSYLFYVKVIKIMNAQLNEEIDLPEVDEILGVTSIYDKLYYQGESLQRKGIKGIFPKGFVKKIENDEVKRAQQTNNNMDCDKPGSSENSSLGQSPVPPSFTPPPLPPDIPYDKFEEAFPKNVPNNDQEESGNDNVPKYEDLPPSYEAAIQAQPFAYGYANYMFNEIEPYGRALYDFEAQDNSELSLRQNQIVHLIRYYDQEWMEGEINGRIGLFPRSYITVIVDCKHPKNQSDSMQSIAPSLSVNNHENNQNQVEAIDFAPNSQARILYDFDGEMEQDLKIRTGDVITMLRRFTSTDWIEAQDSSGNIGFVYKDFCQPIEPNTIPEEENEKNDQQGSSSMYPQIPVEDDEKPIKDYSRQPSSSSKSVCSKPRRAAPAAPRRNNIFPTFNQFLIQDKQEHFQFDMENANNEGVAATQPRRDSQVAKVKNQKQSQRECVITELIQTEKDYCKSLSVAYQAFTSYSSSYEAEKCNVDVKALLGNMQDIIKVSKQLSKSLENYAHNRSFVDQRVGVCFLDLKFDIKESYTQYCRKHDSVHALLKYYEGNSLSQDYMLNCLRRIQDETNCFDLSSIWIKPVQRILKYPLLLNELIKYTEEDHVDYEPLKLAFQMVTDIATYINEYKRRQDLIQKYRQNKNPTLAEKLKNLSMHTFKKKGSRLRHRIFSTLTFQSGIKDKDYEAVLHTFHEVEKIIRTFIKDLKEYMTLLGNYHIQLMVNVEAINEYLDLKQHPRFDYDRIRDSYRQIYQDNFKKFNDSVELNVLKVLTMLLDKFNGPVRLISKREDKRIDYEESLKSKNQDVNLCKNTFEALNQQLIDELPTLSETSLKILANCIESFLHGYRRLTGVMAKYQIDLHELPLVKNLSFGFYQDIEENFRIKNNLNFEQMIREFSLIHASSFQESTSALNRLTGHRNSNTWKNALPIGKTNPNDGQQQQQVKKVIIDSGKVQQTESDRQGIIAKYGPADLYKVTSNFQPCDTLMEIPVQQGDLIAVIKYKEPNGNENRWFVDRGFVQGFIPRNILTSYGQPPMATNQTTPPPNRYDPVATDEIVYHHYDSVPIEPQRYDTVPDEQPPVDHGNDHSSLSSVEISEFDPLALVADTGPRPSSSSSSNANNKTTDDNNSYVAAYPFKASGPNQLSLNFNQRCMVLAKHDPLGNQDWWLVQTECNQKGYVPSNYLKK